MVHPIYTYGTRVLKQKAKPVDKVDEGLLKLIMDMFDTMHGASGIGLAANQIGKLRRVIVVDLSDVEEPKESEEPAETTGFKNHPPIALINPEIVSSEGLWSMEEGCLSIPGVRDMVDRPERIRIRYKDTNFRDVELEADELLARVILHEIDHLDGILFLDHLSAPKKKIHREQLKGIQRGEIDVAYPTITATAGKLGIELTKGA